jgi:hypothetical protein
VVVDSADLLRIDAAWGKREWKVEEKRRKETPVFRRWKVFRTEESRAEAIESTGLHFPIAVPDPFRIDTEGREWKVDSEASKTPLLMERFLFLCLRLPDGKERIETCRQDWFESLSMMIAVVLFCSIRCVTMPERSPESARPLARVTRMTKITRMERFGAQRCTYMYARECACRAHRSELS